MSATPLQSFLGGVCLAFPVHALLSFNNNTFGISGFIHGAARGRLEDAMSVLGLVLGGAAVAVIEGDKLTVGNSTPLPLMLSGLLVGAGTKVRSVYLSQENPMSSPDHEQMSNGCTSGWVTKLVSLFFLRIATHSTTTQTHDLRPVTFLHQVRSFHFHTVTPPRCSTHHLWAGLSPQRRRSV